MRPKSILNSKSTKSNSNLFYEQSSPNVFGSLPELYYNK